METLTVQSTAENPKPYEPIELELTASDIDLVMAAFRDYLRLPYEERIRLHYKDKVRPRTGESGYMYKGIGASQDNKHVFHMTQDIWQNRIDLKEDTLPRAARYFFNVGYEIHDSIVRSAKAKYQELEDEIPGIVGIHFPKNGINKVHTRFLGYREPKDKTLAGGHYDKGTGTIAIAESHGGLQIGFDNHAMETLDRSGFEPIFFSGYGWHQLAEMLDIVPTRRAAWHDVIDTGERVDEEISRLALVSFINPANIYLDSSQEQTHTPIPWRGLGSMAIRSDSKSFLLAA